MLHDPKEERRHLRQESTDVGLLDDRPVTPHHHGVAIVHVRARSPDYNQDMPERNPFLDESWATEPAFRDKYNAAQGLERFMMMGEPEMGRIARHYFGE